MKLLLHTCCAGCATTAIERLQDDWKISLFFSNSNIYPELEFQTRLKDMKKIAEIYQVDLIKDPYVEESWLNYVKGLENEPERGERCKKCIEYRLNRTVKYAKENNFDAFTTTLTTSPHKDASYINTIGEKLGKSNDIQFINLNLKKKDGFQQSIELSKKHKLYRQDYCGCRFSHK